MPKFVKSVVKCLIGLSVFALIAGCTGFGASQDLPPEQPIEGLQILVFTQDSRDELGERFGSLIVNDFSSLTPDDLRAADIIITDRDIVSYDWDLQQIQLSRNGQSGTLEHSPIPHYSAFVVTFQDQPLLSGLVLLTVSPFAIETPILYVEPTTITSNQDVLTIYLRPHYANFFTQTDLTAPFPGEDKETAELLRQYLQAEGKLSD